MDTLQAGQVTKAHIGRDVRVQIDGRIHEFTLRARIAEDGWVFLWENDHRMYKVAPNTPVLVAA